MTVSACVVPAGTETGFGVIVSEFNVAACTVTVAEPEVELMVAVTLVVPAAVEVRNPLLPLVLLTFA